jgi:hypothetical protein
VVALGEVGGMPHLATPHHPDGYRQSRSPCVRDFFAGEGNGQRPGRRRSQSLKIKINCAMSIRLNAHQRRKFRKKRSRPKKTIEAIGNVSDAFLVLAQLNSLVFLVTVIVFIYLVENY